jgi:hypothetical protein
VESVPAGAPRRWSRSSTARCCSAGRLGTRVLMRRGSRSWGGGGARPRCPHGAAPFTRAAAISTPASCRWLLLSDAGGHEATPTSDARACTNAGVRLVRRFAPADRQSRMSQGARRWAGSINVPQGGHDEEGTMESVLCDAAGHHRSPATMPGFHNGRSPRNKGSCRRRHDPFYAHRAGMPTSP